VLRTNARAVVMLPDRTGGSDVAALADAGLIAYHAVKKAAPLLHPGSTWAVMGTGGLGHIAVLWLRALTATRVVVPTVTTRPWR
jgi:NAD+-dependent secondary alcohol dehydrogenase Adh1